MEVPLELIESSKALYDAYRPRADVAGATLDATIAGEQWTSHPFRLLSFSLPDRSLTIRVEHASACRILRVTCAPVIAGKLTVEQADGQLIRRELLNGATTVDGVAPTWTSVVIQPDHRSANPVRTAWTLL